MSEQSKHTATIETDRGLYWRIAGYISQMTKDITLEDIPLDHNVRRYYRHGESSTTVGDTTIWRDIVALGTESDNKIGISTPDFNAKAGHYLDMNLGTKVTYGVTDTVPGSEHRVESTLKVVPSGGMDDVRLQTATGEFAGLSTREALERVLLDVALMAGYVAMLSERAQQETQDS